MKNLERPARRFLFMAVSAAMAFLTAGIVVQACTDGATTTEVSFTTAWPSCDQDLIKQFWIGWGVTDDSWNPAGISDDCKRKSSLRKGHERHRSDRRRTDRSRNLSPESRLHGRVGRKLPFRFEPVSYEHLSALHSRSWGRSRGPERSWRSHRS